MNETAVIFTLCKIFLFANCKILFGGGSRGHLRYFESALAVHFPILLKILINTMTKMSIKQTFIHKTIENFTALPANRFEKGLFATNFGFLLLIYRFFNCFDSYFPFSWFVYRFIPSLFPIDLLNYLVSLYNS